jgi:hypothetical protein
MATAPRIRPNSPDTSELGIKTFNPAVAPRNTDSVIQIGKDPIPTEKLPKFENMSERQQIRMLWGALRRRRKTRKPKGKKKRSTRRR